VSRGGVASIATKLRVGRSRIQIPVGARYFSLLQYLKTVPGTHSANCSMATWVLSLDKAVGRWNYHSSTSIVEAKDERDYTSTPLHAFVSWTQTTFPLTFYRFLLRPFQLIIQREITCTLERVLLYNLRTNHTENMSTSIWKRERKRERTAKQK
jgi:hypothetical protein